MDENDTQVCPARAPPHTAYAQPVTNSQPVAQDDAASGIWGRLSSEMPGDPIVYDLRRSPTVVGRHRACDIVIAKPVISNRHCIFTMVVWAFADTDN